MENVCYLFWLFRMKYADKAITEYNGFYYIDALILEIITYIVRSELHHLKSEANYNAINIMIWQGSVEKKTLHYCHSKNIRWTIEKYVGCKLLLQSYAIIQTLTSLITKLSRTINIWIHLLGRNPKIYAAIM